jgi:GntR family transcriptional regulator, gluconate operon transcriptional repressor
VSSLSSRAPEEAEPLSSSSSEVIERADLWQTVAARLRYAIIGREFKPRQHLPEPALAQRFGVSRVPVREALIRLEQEGLVRAEPRRGAFVVGMSLADMRELYEVRALLEVRGARLAANTATPEDVTNIRSLIRDFGTVTKRGDSEALAATDIAFHRSVMTAAHHRRLLSTWEPLSGVIQTLLTLTNERGTSSHIVSAHRRLATAISSGDPDAAESVTLKMLSEGLANAELTWTE